MCEWGNEVCCVVEVPADLSHTGAVFEKLVGIDSCIAPIVDALNKAGIKTRQSCCGHYKMDGQIDLQDGRMIIVRASN